MSAGRAIIVSPPSEASWNAGLPPDLQRVARGLTVAERRRVASTFDDWARHLRASATLMDGGQAEPQPSLMRLSVEVTNQSLKALKVIQRRWHLAKNPLESTAAWVLRMGIDCFPALDVRVKQLNGYLKAEGLPDDGMFQIMDHRAVTAVRSTRR